MEAFPASGSVETMDTSQQQQQQQQQEQQQQQMGGGQNPEMGQQHQVQENNGQRPLFGSTDATQKATTEGGVSQEQAPAGDYAGDYAEVEPEER